MGGCGCSGSSTCSNCACPYDTIVYASAAQAYGGITGIDNQAVMLTEIIEGGGGYLSLYRNPESFNPAYCCKKCSGKCSSQIYSQVFAAAIKAGTEAFLMMPTTGDTGVAGQAFSAVNALLGQYLAYPFKCCNEKEIDCCQNVCNLNNAIPDTIAGSNAAWCIGKQSPGEVFLTAFGLIYTYLSGINTAANINLAYITSIVHYLNLQLCITPVYAISTYQG